MRQRFEMLTSQGIEYGSNSEGSWIKYSNGIIEQFLKTETSKGYTSAYGTLFQLENAQVAKLPIAIKKSLYCNASAFFGGCAIVGNIEHTTTAVSCRVLNATRTLDGAYITKVNFYSVGLWK